MTTTSKEEHLVNTDIKILQHTFCYI